MNENEQKRVLQKENGELVAAKCEINEILNKQFKSVFSKETQYPLPEFKTRTNVFRC